VPNTLVHFAAQGAASRALWRRLDPRFLYLGCVLPDLPWILRRAIVALGVPVDVFDLRLYTMGLASLAITLLLAAAVAVATTAPRRVFAWLGLNALLHLLLDATEIKFGNGVHLLAPFSWRMTSFELLPGESPVYLLLTIGGALLVLWDIARRRDFAVGWQRRPRSWAAAAALAVAYLVAPLPFLSAIEASDSYSVKTLREKDARSGRRVSLDRVHFAASPAGGFLELWTGERVRATGALPDHDATVSLHGTFLAPDVLRADVLVEQRRNRDWPTYLGLALLAVVFLRGIIPPMRTPLAVLALAVLAPLAAQAAAAPKPARPPFSVVEAGIADLQAALAERRVTSRELVLLYLQRIALYEDRLNAVMTVNREALRQADALDQERAAGRIRGPLHGIPIALKDNIHTTDMPTTGGALAFDGLVPPYEATLAKNLRDAGAIILAKTVLTELANWVAGPPSPMPANYSALAGYGFNPYDPRRDPREATFDGRPALSTGGSSSGIGTAVSFWAANVGTETSGSILSPANQNMLVGIKPTVGRVSRYGVIPITADQDTPGPMARSVRDAAILLGALEGTAPDPGDEATKACAPPPGRDYTKFLDAGALKGARIGVPRAFYYDKTTPPGAKEPRGGLNPDQAKSMAEAIGILREQGAVVVDPADIPSVVETDERRNFLLWGICGGAGDAKGSDASCSVVFKYGMKRDFDKWLLSLGERTPVKTLTELRHWNADHQKAGAIKYGQSLLDISDEMQVDGDRARYEADRARDLELAGTHGIREVMKAESLDALLFPGSSGAAIAARPGYPTVIVPFGLVPNAPTPPFPEAFAAQPSPYGVSFTGLACSEPRLIALAYAFEQATKRRRPPALFP
jgi:amidase